MILFSNRAVPSLILCLSLEQQVIPGVMDRRK